MAGDASHAVQGLGVFTGVGVIGTPVGVGLAVHAAAAAQLQRASAYTYYAYDEPARHFCGCWGVQVARLVSLLRVMGGIR